jgi:hypothetical protein
MNERDFLHLVELEGREIGAAETVPETFCVNRAPDHALRDRPHRWADANLGTVEINDGYALAM